MTPPQSRAKMQAFETLLSGKLNRKEGFIEVPTAALIEQGRHHPNLLPEVDLYLFEPGETKPKLIRKADQACDFMTLSLNPSVWIRESDLTGLVRQAEIHAFDDLAKQEGIPIDQRARVVKKAAMAVVEDLFEHPSPQNVERSKKVVSSFVYLIMKDPHAHTFLIELSEHDPYTLQHSIGTAVNAIILGKKTGHLTGLSTSEEGLMEIGLGGLLHDVGKVKVRREVINKEGPLDEFEWEEMRQHSQAGYDIVKDHPGIPNRAKRVILEHHEDRIGSGYPHRLREDQLDPASKIVCVTDIFNAITTDRTYSRPRSTFDALEFMRAKLVHKVDPDLFKELVKIYGTQ